MWQNISVGVLTIHSHSSKIDVMIGNCSFVNSVNTAFAIQVLQLEFVECNVHSITFSNVLVYNTMTNSNASTGIVYVNTEGIRNLIAF